MDHLSSAFTRRHFLAAAGASLAAIGVSGRAASPEIKQFAASPEIKRLTTSLTLAWLASVLEKDLDATLHKIAAIGYKQVEVFDGLHPNPKQLRELLNAAGLQCESSLFWRQFESLDSDLSKDWSKDSELSRQIDFAHALGLRYMVFAYVPFARGENLKTTIAATNKLTLDDYKREAQVFNKIGAQTKKAGIEFAYHNHNFEFRNFGGVLGYDELLRSSDPDLVKMEMDVGWVTAGGQDPARYLREYVGRFCTLHVKDVKVRDPNTVFRLEPAELGQGVVDWPNVLEAARTSGVKIGFVEYEPHEPLTRPLLESAKSCFDYLQTLVK